MNQKASSEGSKRKNAIK